ncbi:MFS transporter [Noviherbaspirillum denitrificans]|uniref:MFS transporter n=1 Tax=Noviherbaspirillum denitrificans TaxID=1968433 RepID=A0A254TLR7_9BURK|nr:MFS transporter [Noviherbaspirillum denitrificans]OWW20648.1 MFS transporter [Noviherbaspirillum denitrificans]
MKIAQTSVNTSIQTDGNVRTLEIAMFLVLLASYVINAMDRQIFPLVAADVRREYGFALGETGLLSTIFTMGMALAGLPTAYLLARCSRKAVLQIGIAIFSTGTLLTAYSFGFADMMLYRATTGVGEAMQLTVLIAIAGNYFFRYRATAIGAINFSFGLGAIVGPTLGGYLLGAERLWRVPLVWFGLIGFISMAIIALMVSRRLTEATASVQAQGNSDGAANLMNRNTIILTVMSMIGGMVIYGYLGMYPTYLREQLHFAPTTTGGVMSMYGLGVFASIFGGWLGDRLPPRLLLVTTFLSTAALGVLLFLGSTNVVFHSTLSFAWGFIASGILYVNLAGYHVKAVRAGLTGKATGLFVTSLYAAGAVAGYVIGSLAAKVGWSAAGIMQITSLAIVGALLAVGLQPERMAGFSRKS